MDLTTLATTITALGVVFGAFFAVHKWFLKREKQDRDIKAIKEEQTVLVHGTMGTENILVAIVLGTASGLSAKVTSSF